MDVPGGGGWYAWSQIRRELREAKADALLMTGHHLVTMLAIGQRWKGNRVLAIHYHHRGVKPDWQWRLIYALARRRFDAVTFPSAFIRNEAWEIDPMLRRKSVLIPCPADVLALPTAQERAAARQTLGLPPTAPIVGNAGWLIPRKRWDVFLQVAARIAQARPEAHFLVAGDGPLKSELCDLAHRLGLTDRLHWLGWQQNLATFYRSLDVLVFNSDWDALPVTPQEAMSYAIPVAASLEHSGLREIINSESVGCILPSHDVRALSAQVLAWLDDPDEARAVGLAGRARIQEVADPDRIAVQYEQLLAGHPPVASGA